MSAAVLLVVTAASGPCVSAFEDVPANDGYLRRLFAEDLDRPEAVAPRDDHTALVAERSGRILLLEGERRSDLGSIRVPGTNIFYVPERPCTEGLKDFVPVPGRPGVFLWSMTTGSAEAVRWTVGRATVETSTGQPPILAGSEILWQSEPQPWSPSSGPPFSACKLVVDGADVLAAMGANSRAAGSGRIVRIALDGAHPPRVVSTGHRNPGGVVFRSGVLWEVEHGPKGGDELNVIVAGGDYGWPEVSPGEPDDVNHQSFLKERPGAIEPVAVWTPAIAPSSLTAWRGKLYVGALQGAAVIELTVEGTKVISQRRALEFGTRVRDVRADPEGRLLWVLTDGPHAKLFQVSPARATPEPRAVIREFFGLFAVLSG